MNLQLGTIQVYISAVSYLHHMNGHRSPASNNPMIKFLVQGVERSMPAAHLKPKRQPITNEMLGQMLSQLDRDHKPSHDRLVLKAAITLGIFGLLRVSEFTVPNQHGFNPDQHLTTKDITMRRDSMVVVIKKSKTRPEGGKLPDQRWLDTHQVLPTPCNAEIPRSDLQGTPCFYLNQGQHSQPGH